GIGALGLVLGLTRLQLSHFLVLGVAAFITILYSFPLLPFPGKRRLKDFGLLKIAILSFVWTLITVWFPVVTLRRITSSFMLVFAGRFLFLFALCLAFDIRDKPSDAREGIHTLPVMLGVKACYQLIRLSLVLFVAIAILHFRETGRFLVLNGMILSALATYFMVEYSRTRSSDLVYLAGIDGMMLLQALLVGLAGIH
ncbi:MAG TPA: UbiA family prenyltransferase, partial [Chitinophagaceae bacterium]|nr:UbiA family prenyltransferase [Chitinophagaceae bacterium]